MLLTKLILTNSIMFCAWQTPSTISLLFKGNESSVFFQRIFGFSKQIFRSFVVHIIPLERTIIAKRISGLILLSSIYKILHVCKHTIQTIFTPSMSTWIFGKNIRKSSFFQLSFYFLIRFV